MPDILEGRISVRSKLIEKAVKLTIDNIYKFELLFGTPLPPVREFVGWHNNLVHGGRPAREGDYFLSHVHNMDTLVIFIDEISFDRMYELVEEPKNEVVVHAPVIGAKGEP